MDPEEEKPKAFKVEDRRRFSSEGELKEEFRAETARADSSTSAAAEHIAAPPFTPSSDMATRSTPVNQPADEGAAIAEMTFATFMVSLSTQALMHLGEVPDPNSGQFLKDLAGAEHLIDLIAMLQDKTRGNLDEAETQLVQTILFELRMKYVERARQSPH